MSRARRSKQSHRESDNRQLHILRLIDEGTAAQTGANFFRALVECLARALDARYAFVSHFCDENTRVHVLALWDGASVLENFYYQLAGSPCEGVLGGEIVAYRANVVEKFPAEKEDLEQMGAESYLAIPLRNEGGQVLGHLAVIDTQPKDWAERDFEILRIFAARATAEIERQVADREMQAANAALARRVELEGLIASISTRFVTAAHGTVGAEIDRTLGQVGQFIGSDRGLLYLFNPDRTAAVLAHDWVRDDSRPAGVRLNQIRGDVVPEVLEHFARRLTVNAARPEDLPPGFAKLNELPGAERVRSRIAVPIVNGNDSLGILCFHSVAVERHWPNEDLRLLGMLAEIIGSALAREQTQVDLQLAKTTAESANRAKTEFLANMSHELRTPLNGILGYAQLLRRSDEVPSSAKHGIEAIERCGDHLLMLISEILDLAKIEAGRLELEPTAFALDDFLQEIADIARLRATQSGLTYSQETPAGLPRTITADQSKLRQILLNLLGNAIKFTEAGTITFDTSVLAPAAGRCRLRFEIRDTGIGIAPDQLGNIFRPFHQIKHNDRQIEGTGLGLAICRRLIDLMGGTLDVSSEPGRGSLFAAEIDADTSAAQNDAGASLSYPRGYRGARRSILMADDNTDNRRVLGQFLQSLGFTIVEAHNGAEAVETARSIRPDIIFMDLVMPVKDGFEAIREIRAIAAIAGTPIVAVSASAFDTTRNQSRAAGCDAFVAKPVRLDEITALIAKLLGLEWIYSVQTDPPIEALANDARESARKAGSCTADLRSGGRVGIGRSDPLAFAALPKPFLTDLYELARSGDVVMLEQRLRELGVAAPAAKSALSELACYVAEFDMNTLRGVLQPLVEGAP